MKKFLNSEQYWLDEMCSFLFMDAVTDADIKRLILNIKVKSETSFLSVMQTFFAEI